MDLAVDLIFDQQMDGPFGQILDRLADRRQRRPNDFRHRRVVESGHGDVRRDVQTGPVQSKHDPRRHVVVGAGHRAHLHAFTKQLGGGLGPRPEGEVAGRGPRLPFDSGRTKRVEETVEPERRRPVLRRPLDEGHIAVPQRRQVPSDGVAARALVDADRRNRASGLVACGHRDDAHTRFMRRLDEIHIVGQWGRQDDPGGLLAVQDRRE
jgi:hypothetical protein